MSYQFQVHHFNWVPSGWQQIQNQRAKIAASNAKFENSENSFNNGLFSAIASQMSGSATDAAQEALDRVQAQATAASNSNTSQITQAQQLLGDAQSSSPSSATTGSVVDTVA